MATQDIDQIVAHVNAPSGLERVYVGVPTGVTGVSSDGWMSTGEIAALSQGSLSENVRTAGNTPTGLYTVQPSDLYKTIVANVALDITIPIGLGANFLFLVLANTVLPVRIIKGSGLLMNSFGQSSVGATRTLSGQFGQATCRTTTANGNSADDFIIAGQFV